jgi:hypothetical protein
MGPGRLIACLVSGGEFERRARNPGVLGGLLTVKKQSSVFWTPAYRWLWPVIRAADQSANTATHRPGFLQRFNAPI